MAKTTRTAYVPIEERDPATVRAVILARKSSNGSESDVQSQVEECQKFVQDKGWTLVADPYKYTEIGRSGRYNVVRKVLEAVVLLAQRREVDVIVAREPERLSRKSERRSFYIEFCRMYGVEWRFANLKPDGKLPDTIEGKIVGMVAELFGEIEAERIAERMTPGRERRYAAGLPAGGRAGAPYGYKWRPKEGDAKTYSGFIEDQDQAPIVHEIFTRLATDEHASARGLARELAQRGVPSATNSNWTGTQIIEMVRNPIYCGRGRRKRWQSTMVEKVDEKTGQVNEYSVARDRLRDPEHEQETYPLAEGMVPVLVEPEIWEAAQRAIARNRIFGGKLTRLRSPHSEDETLLHGGFVFCARCGGMMTRHWRSDYVEPKPTYACTAAASTPNHHCLRHEINAKAADRIVRRTLAKALTDPEQLLALADAAEQQASEAAAALDRADTTLQVYRDRMAELEKKRDGYLAAIAALSAIPGNENHDTITDLRAKLAELDKERTKAEEDHQRAIPQYERALRRQQMLERLTRFTGRRHLVNFETGETWLEIKGEGERVLKKSLDVSVAAEFLGMSEADLKATGIPTDVARLVEDPENDPQGVWVEDVDTENVVYLLLTKAPHDRVRQLLRDLGVQVLIKPPRTKEERALHGLTPHEERVIVRFLVDPDEAIQRRPSDKKPHDLSSLSRW